MYRVQNRSTTPFAAASALRRPRERWHVLAACAALLATATELPAAEGSRTGGAAASGRESAGLASGFAVGAAAGGPFGALLGAAAGAWLGDRMHRNETSLRATRAHLQRTQRDTLGLSLDAMFRTGEASLRAEDEAALRRLAALLRDRGDVVLRVSGYADPRGSAAYNAALAERRAQAVAALLRDAGMPQQRLIVQSFGTAATASLGGAARLPHDADSWAFERRVTVQVEALAPAPPDDVRS